MAKPTVGILYGFAEGPKIGRPLIAELRHQGFKVVDAKKAEVLIAHSGGYHLIPKDTEYKTILLIGPSFGYEGTATPRTAFSTQFKKVSQDFRYCNKNRRLGWWFIKSCRNLGYIFSRYKYNKAMWDARPGNTVPKLKTQKPGIILYRDDPWSWHLDRPELAHNYSGCLISHPGIHDDIWMHPKEYVTILKSLIT